MQHCLNASESITLDLRRLCVLENWWKTASQAARFELKQRAAAEPCAFSRDLLSRGQFAQAVWLGSWLNMPPLDSGPLEADARMGPLVLRFRLGPDYCFDLLELPVDWDNLAAQETRAVRADFPELHAAINMLKTDDPARFALSTEEFDSPLLMLPHCAAGPGVAALTNAFWAAERELNAAPAVLANLLEGAQTLLGSTEARLWDLMKASTPHKQQGD